MVLKELTTRHELRYQWPVGMINMKTVNMDTISGWRGKSIHVKTRTTAILLHGIVRICDSAARCFTVNRSAEVRLRRSHSYGKFIVILLLRRAVGRQPSVSQCCLPFASLNPLRMTWSPEHYAICQRPENSHGGLTPNRSPSSELSRLHSMNAADVWCDSFVCFVVARLRLDHRVQPTSNQTQRPPSHRVAKECD